ncbi:hypothetical protein QTP86_015892, partial [Hemibagrus guttatus]
MFFSSAVLSAVQMESGEELKLHVSVPEPVEVIYKSSGSADEVICRVNNLSLQCKDEYRDRTSLTYPEITLRHVEPRDSGSYTIRDTENEQDIQIYAVSVEGPGFPVWGIVLIVLILLICAAVGMYLLWKHRMRKQLERRKQLVDQFVQQAVGGTEEKIREVEESLIQLMEQYINTEYSDEVSVFCREKRKQLGAGGNWATVGRRSRGGRRVHRQREKRKGKSVGLRIGTLNVGTMTGKGRELADMMERRKVDILCVQETRWKGSKARSIGAGFKLFYYGVDSKRNGVGVVLKEEFVRNVLEVKRVSDRVMSLKLEIEGVMLNVVSGYAPQVGCELEEKERFWSELDEVMESIPTGERVVIEADFNGHVGEGNTGDEEVMGKFGVKERNLEGQMVVDFAKRMDMAVVNTYFQKREEHRVTYKSGGRRTQVDYILCRRGNLKEISDCKVVVGESVARQHRMVVCRMTLMVCKKKRSEIEKKTKWWKLKKEKCCEEFRQKLRQALGGQVVLPEDWETTAEVIRETGRKVLGVSSGRRKEDKETWWWNEEVQDSIQRKRLAKKKWDMDRTEENRQEYKELQRRVKREVSKAKQKAYDELYTRLDTRGGEKDLYRLARQRDRDGKDVQQVRVIKDRDGRVLTSEESVQRRWKEYFEELMNEENEREKRVEGVNSVEQKVDKIRKDEVRKALKRMKSGKAVGPDDIPVEVWKCLGEAAVEFLASLFNRVLESERMPEEWRRSVLVPIFKNKGDVQSCSNYRGIKLMSHTMKLWERVVEARLRKVVEICEQQYGFMPRKSTTDAIFALRILMEKYRDGQKELHCVFVDLEKVYDRVPREELWYCMRKSGVAEKYVRVVQDMYERSRTVVRCAVGQTEEFKVEVGLHQGSALSPFLFAIVMDQLSEEVRQESPWTMMFADDIVICSESREQVEENLERWRFALERRGMKVSGSKTEYMCVNEREGSGTVRLQGEEVKKVQEFKYVGSTVQSNGECGKELERRKQLVDQFVQQAVGGTEKIREVEKSLRQLKEQYNNTEYSAEVSVFCSEKRKQLLNRLLLGVVQCVQQVEEGKQEISDVEKKIDDLDEKYWGTVYILEVKRFCDVKMSQLKWYSLQHEEHRVTEKRELDWRTVHRKSDGEFSIVEMSKENGMKSTWTGSSALDTLSKNNLCVEKPADFSHSDPRMNIRLVIVDQLVQRDKGGTEEEINEVKRKIDQLEQLYRNTEYYKQVKVLCEIKRKQLDTGGPQYVAMTEETPLKKKMNDVEQCVHEAIEGGKEKMSEAEEKIYQLELHMTSEDVVEVSGFCMCMRAELFWSRLHSDKDQIMTDNIELNRLLLGVVQCVQQVEEGKQEISDVEKKIDDLDEKYWGTVYILEVKRFCDVKMSQLKWYSLQHEEHRVTEKRELNSRLVLVDQLVQRDKGGTEEEINEVKRKIDQLEQLYRNTEYYKQVKVLCEIKRKQLDTGGPQYEAMTEETPLKKMIDVEQCVHEAIEGGKEKMSEAEEKINQLELHMTSEDFVKVSKFCMCMRAELFWSRLHSDKFQIMTEKIE